MIMKILRSFAMLLAVAGLFACTEPTPIPDTISATPATVTFEPEGGEAKVAVTVGGETDEYSFSTAPDWLNVKQNGRELVITAEPNLVKAPREFILKLTKGNTFCEVKIEQKIGTPYLGYAVADSISVEYAGEMMFSFLKPVSEEHGGMEYIILGTEENKYVFEVYTTNFETAEDVKVEEVEYLPGKDDYNTLTLYAEKNTFALGTKMEDGDESYCMGSYISNRASETDTPIKDGKIKVFKGDEGYVILAEVKDAEGNEHKVVYEGEIEINTEGAKFPSQGHGDPTVNVYSASLSQNEEGSAVHTLTLLSGDEENPIMTNFEIVLPTPFNPEDFSGEYYINEEEPGAPGSINLGSLVDFGGFQFPMGSYIMFSFGEYCIGDGFASLVLEKQDDGKYLISGSIANADMSEFYFFMNINLNIEYYPASSGEED